MKKFARRAQLITFSLATAMAAQQVQALDPIRELEYRNLGGSFSDADLDQDGNVYMTGASGNIYTTTKFNANGTLAWQRKHDSKTGSWYGTGATLTIDGLGNTYVALTASYVYGRLLKYDPQGNETLLSSGSTVPYNWDHSINLNVDDQNNVYLLGTGFVEKYSADGVKQWRAKFSNKWGASTRDLEVDAAGNVYVLGKRDASAWNNIVLSKYSVDGALVWMRSFPVSGFSGPIGVETDSQDNLVIAASRTLTSGYYGETLIKYSPEGSLLTSTDIDRGNTSYIRDFEMDGADNVYLTGSFGGDLFAEKLDANFSRMWYQQRDFGWGETGWDLALDDGGNVYVTGNAPTGYHWSNEAFVTLKWDANGVEQWAMRDVRGHGRWIAVQKGMVYSGGRTLWPHDALVIGYDDATNSAPVANVGSYLPQECTGPLTQVTLDGSNSSDADGDPLNFSWAIGVPEFATTTGVAPSVSLPLGTTAITLTVTDGNGGSDSQTGEILIQDTTAPAVNAGADQTLIAQGPAGAPFTLTYTAEDLCGGIGVVVSPVLASYPVGQHNIAVTATDDSGNSATDQMTLTVAYGFGGFLAPLKENGVYKLGRTLPIKFQLRYADGSLVTDAQPTLLLQPLSNNEPVGEPIDPQTNVDTGADSSFRFADDHYIYNLKTDYLSKGTYRLMVDLGDGAGYQTYDIGFK